MVFAVSILEAPLSSSSAFERPLPPGLSFGRADDPAHARGLPLLRDLADEALMRLVQAGNREALGALFDRYASLIRRVGSRILHDTAEAEDLVQEVFLYVHRKSEIFDPEKGQLVSWLVQIAYSRAFNRRERLKASESADCARIEELADAAQLEERWVDLVADELAARQMVEQALAELSEVQRETLRLYFFEGYSLREISARLAQTHANTRHYYYRGIEKLKEILKRGERRD